METIKEAKDFLRGNWEKGVDCPCCKQFVKLYKRKLNSGMALTLCRIYKESISDKKWIPVKDFLRQNKFKNGHDWTLLRFWGLLEEKQKDSNDNETKNSGYWRITEKGEAFTLNKIDVPRQIFIYNSKIYGVSEDRIKITKCLGDDFNYEELMNS
jgi:hypothetical protein